MPHIPRGMSSSMSGVRRELLATVRTDRPTIPVTQPAAKTEEKKKLPARRRLGLDRISPHTYEPDIDEICSLMLGTEAKSNDHTGELVFSKSPAASAIANGPGG